MLRVVVDTNVLISSLLTVGKSRALLNAALRGKLKLMVSRPILDEFREVLGREKFRNYLKRGEVEEFIERLIQISDLVEVKSNFRVIEEDPDDDVILNTAHDGKADYIVSGDEHLLVLRNFKGIKILNVGQMLEKLTPARRSKLATW